MSAGNNEVHVGGFVTAEDMHVHSIQLITTVTCAHFDGGYNIICVLYKSCIYWDMSKVIGKSILNASHTHGWGICDLCLRGQRQYQVNRKPNQQDHLLQTSFQN